MNPPAGKPVRVDCERARERLQEACDEGTLRDAERHCEACAGEAALLGELEALLRSEPLPEPPADFAVSVVALVRADLARARRNARLALAGAVAALVALAVLIGFLDAPLAAGELAQARVVTGAVGAAQDFAELGRVALDAAPTLALPSLEVPAPVSYAWVALAGALVLVVAEVGLLARRRVAA